MGIPKQRPKSLFASFLRPDGSEVVEEYSSKDQPYVLLMPIWNVPGIALGKPPTADFDVTQGHLYIFTSEDVQKRIAAEDGAQLCGSVGVAPNGECERAFPERSRGRRASG